METLAITLSLLAAVAFGSGDFFGGMGSKRAKANAMIISSQLIGLVAYIILALVTQETFPEARYLVIGMFGGLFGCIGLNALYRGLATGRMGLVAPVSAVLAAIIPMIYGVFTLGLLPIHKFLGLGIALVAVWLISRSEQLGKIQWRDLVLPVIAGLGFGIAFIFVSELADGTVFWGLTALRITSITVMFLFTLFSTRSLVRQEYFVPMSVLWFVALAGGLDSIGNVLLILANQNGRVDIVNVLSSLYPAPTILLAWWLLKEKIIRPQLVGIVLALIAIALITI
jgi:uncharacterized membrane protein